MDADDLLKCKALLAAVAAASVRDSIAAGLATPEGRAALELMLKLFGLSLEDVDEVMAHE
jgi:hypothetical protein